MKPLVATRHPAPLADGGGSPVGAVERFSDGCFSVDVSGTGAALAVAADLVVVLVGRIDEMPRDPLPDHSRDVAGHVLTAWRRAGPKVLMGSSGDFVVLCYDRRSTDLSVFRDIAGGVPAYLVGGDRPVVTTTLAAALTNLPRVTVDWQWTRAYLALEWPEEGLTPYEEVQLLPPGWLATLDRTGAWHSRRFDDWQWVEDVPEALDESADRFRALFDQAVARRVATVDGAVAVTTSGGLDSSSVLVTARHVAPDRPLVALALAFTDARGDERVYQEAVAAAADVRLEWVEAAETPGPFGDGPDAVIAEHAGPPVVGNWFLHAAMRRRAEELGVARVLDGEDGDGVVGGNALYLADLLGRGRLLQWARETHSLARTFDLDLVRLVRRCLGQTRAAARAHRLGRSYEMSVRDLVRGGFLSTITAETYVIWAGLPAGIAHPFLDRRVIEYALTMPTRQRISGGQPKVLLRRAMGERLPALVARRMGKADLSSAFLSALEGEHAATLREGCELAHSVLRKLNADAHEQADMDETPPNLYAAYRRACVGFWGARAEIHGAQLSWSQRLPGA